MTGSPTKSTVAAWLDERLGWSAIKEFAQHKRIPLHRHTVWYYLGGMTLFCFLVQIGTGILLLLYYRPTAEAAFESVEFIMTDVRFGWLVRSIHSWSANLMLFFAFVHMFSVFFLRAYRKPRELTWVSGALLLFLSLGFGFSGYLLPWNQLAYFATKVGTDILGQIPLIGHWLLTVARGGDEVSGATLTRFFGVHVAVLPMIATFFLVVHLAMVQKQGMSVPIGPSYQNTRTMPFFPNFALRDLVGWTLALGILVLLASIFPWELGVKADPLASAPAGIRPEWFFCFMFQTLKYIPSHVLFMPGELLGIIGFSLGGVALILVPFLDRRAAREERNGLMTAIGCVVILYMAVFTLLAYVR
ncbi:MAG: cytochrome bc complex cytochrome b subunit [candidate division Zixibacteria bacterium]|nr:cytochrome bc complex cytochrome b subunit [candidate division Zixibacteria bacterium]